MTALRIAMSLCFAYCLAVADGAHATDAQCQVPVDHVKPHARLNVVAAALKRQQPVRIVVVGTGSSAGAGIGGPQAAYPAQLERRLGERWGPGRVAVVNLSSSGQTAEQMAAQFPQVIRLHQPTLVVWQTGTVDAVRSLGVNAFGDAIERGIKIAADARVDLMLVNPQFGSQAFTLRDVSLYLEYMDQIARGRDVLLFDRYAIMKHWAESGWRDLGPVPASEQKRVAERVHECLGVLMAKMIVEASE